MTRKQPENRTLSRRKFVGEAGGAALGLSVAAESFAQQTAPPAVVYKPLDPGKKIRIGVVGGGFGASFSWHRHPNCVVQAVSDLIPERRARLTKVYQCGRAYESLEKMILAKDLDAVAVFTGADRHARHVVAVMESGKDVISAVPACHTLEEARRVKETKERTGRKYMMAETSYYYPEGMLARDFYKAGAFGQVFYTEVEYYHNLIDGLGKWWYEPDGKPTWRNGYPPFLYPSHGTAFSTGVTRERVVSASAMGVCAPKIDRVPPGDNGYTGGRNPYGNPYNCGVMLFQTEKGNLVRCNVIYAGTNGGEHGRWFGTDMTFFMENRLSGQPSRWWGPGAPKWTKVPDYSQALPPEMRGFTAGHAGSEMFLVNEFISALMENREPVIDVYEALAMCVPGIVAFQSALKGGELMKVPRFDPGA